MTKRFDKTAMLLPRDAIGAPQAGLRINGHWMIFLPVVSQPVIDVFTKRKPS